ncbi:MAG: rod shape-determining protein MreC [Bryobacteraceae bacterium]
MEVLLSRFRNLTVLLIVIVAQLLCLAYQVKTNRDQRLIRVWAVTAVTPMAGIVEAVRRNTIGFLEDYFILLDVREQNRKLRADNDHLRMDNIYYRNQLTTAEHARALSVFQAQSPSKTVAARVIGNSTVVTAKAVFIDRGSTSGIDEGMAVVTPDGIVGKVTAVYPLVSQVLLVTDPTFKVGVESQKGHVHGVLNCGAGKCSVEQIQNEDKIEIGEAFYTSGEDRIFPKGFPVGQVVSSQPGQGTKDIKLNLSGAPGGVDEVLIVLQGVHQQIPSAPVLQQAAVKMLPPPPEDSGAKAAQPSKPQTEADKIVEKYNALGKAQAHVYGALGSNVPNFNLKQSSEPGQMSQDGTPPEDSARPDSAARSGAKVESSPAPTTSTPPAILGARPSPKAPPPNTVTPQAPSVIQPAPVLPLGAPRRKPATPPAAPNPQEPKPPPQQ